jgi:hypothetical protein
MASDLRRAVVLGPAGCIYPGGPQDYTVAGNPGFFRDTRTRWVRMWADWPTLEPGNGQIDAAKFAALDRQIAAARRDGLRVVLTLYRFPTWANGYDAAQAAAYAPDRRTQNQAETSSKQAVFKIPPDVSPASPWGRFVDRILARYGRGNPSRPSLDAVVDVLEICNEPNLQWWPQQDPYPDPATPYASDGTRISVHRTVARMFATAQQLAGARPLGPVLAGPGCADVTSSNRLSTAYDSFANRLLAELATLGFTAGPQFAYSHHNYTDVTYDQGAATTGPDATRTKNFAADMRRRLVGKWAGWPAGDPASPGLLLTEGGVTLASIASASRWGISDRAAQLAKQAELLQRNWDRMAAGPDSPGISMVSQYLWYTDPNYDSGLCDTSESGGAKRPAYATWRSLPSRA